MTVETFKYKLTLLEDKIDTSSVLVKTKNLPLHSELWVNTIIVDKNKISDWKNYHTKSKEDWADLMIMCNYVWSKLQ